MSKTNKTFLVILAAGVLLIGTDIVTTATEQLPEANAETVRTTKKTRVMARPGEKSRVIARIDAGTNVKVLSRQGRWIKVRADGRTGWITRSSANATRSANTPVRKTRRKAFVEGRSTRRGFSGGAPRDRVGADALDDEDEEMLEEEPRVAARSAKRPAKRKARDRDRDEDMEEEDFEDEDEGEEPAAQIVVASAESELMAKPSTRSEGVALVEAGQKLTVIEEDGEWMLVEDADGEEGWIRSRDVSQRYAYPKMLKRGGASIGYASLGSVFASDGTGELANYKITTAAATLSVGGDVVYKYSDQYMIAGDARYTGVRASPGIRFSNAMGQTADIGFIQHELSLGGAVGYNMKNKSGMVLYGRAGYHYSKLSINDVGDFEQNLAYLPSEILQGITIGAHADVPRLTDKMGLQVGLDALYPSGTRTQTKGLEDGAVSDVFAAWATGRLIYQWKPNLTLEGTYRYSYAKTGWLGAAQGTMRPHGATEAARKDVGHAAMVGLGKHF
ncbi:MAG TPA: SH3 domain-containing protein [Kofleriaceae bacterium]|nr:SH3 domain-containing protein [Kofleriaceae bacterium]